MSQNSKISVAVIGANGYTGTELVRLLVGHPHVDLVTVTSRQHEGAQFSEVFPAFLGKCDNVFEKLDVAAIASKVKAVFLCLPHHEAMETAALFQAQGTTVFDLSADFRLTDAAIYEKWYGPHSQKELLKNAIYGQPEMHREEIKKSRLIACPGCYPTSIILGLAPLLKAKKIKLEGIICDSKSGISGAGRTAKVESLYAEVNESFKAYGLASHRHTPEIEQELSRLAGSPIQVTFSPHLVPMDRGILSTIYATAIAKTSLEDIHALYVAAYSHEPFVTVYPLKSYPATKSVTGTNECHIGLAYDARLDQIIIVSVIDNLTKGASGQALQAFNLVFGLPETEGLTSIALVP